MSPLLTRRKESHTEEPSPTGQVWLPEGYPEVDLLPAEIRARRGVHALRRRLGVGLVALLVLTLAACGWGWFQDVDARNRLTMAENESIRLNAQLASFSEVVRIQSDIDQTRDAIRLGMRNEVLWADLIRRFQAGLPEFAEIEQMAFVVVFDSEYADTSGGPFETGESIGTINWTIRVGALEHSGVLVDALNEAPGMFDATYTQTKLNIDDGSVQVIGRVLLDESVRSGRFTDEEAQS